jgi:hypothetical protein
MLRSTVTKARRFPGRFVGVACVLVALGVLVWHGPPPAWVPAAAITGAGGVAPPTHVHSLSVDPAAPDYRPVSLRLDLPPVYANDPALASREGMFQAFGFNVKFSNDLPLDRSLPGLFGFSCGRRGKKRKKKERKKKKSYFPNTHWFTHLQTCAC